MSGRDKFTISQKGIPGVDWLAMVVMATRCYQPGDQICQIRRSCLCNNNDISLVLCILTVNIKSILHLY